MRLATIMPNIQGIAGNGLGAHARVQRRHRIKAGRSGPDPVPKANPDASIRVKQLTSHPPADKALLYEALSWLGLSLDAVSSH